MLSLYNFLLINWVLLAFCPTPVLLTLSQVTLKRWIESMRSSTSRRYRLLNQSNQISAQVLLEVTYKSKLPTLSKQRISNPMSTLCSYGLILKPTIKT